MSWIGEKLGEHRNNAATVYAGRRRVAEARTAHGTQRIFPRRKEIRVNGLEMVDYTLDVVDVEEPAGR